MKAARKNFLGRVFQGLLRADYLQLGQKKSKISPRRISGMEGFYHDYTCGGKEKTRFWQPESIVLLLPSIQSILRERLFPFSVIEETWEKENKSRLYWKQNSPRAGLQLETDFWSPL